MQDAAMFQHVSELDPAFDGVVEPIFEIPAERRDHHVPRVVKRPPLVYKDCVEGVLICESADIGVVMDKVHGFFGNTVFTPADHVDHEDSGVEIGAIRIDSNLQATLFTKYSSTESVVIITHRPTDGIPPS